MRSLLPSAKALRTIFFLIMSAFFFWIFPFQIIFFILISMRFLTSLGPLLHFCPRSFLQTLCIMLTFSGTPSSGLVSWAWHRLIPSRRNNNISSSPSLLFPSQTLKPISSAFSKINTIFFAAIAVSGSLLSGLMANPPLFTLAPFIAKIDAHPHRQSSSPLIMPSHALTPESFTLTPVTPFGAPIMARHHPLPLHLHFRIKPALSASWRSSTLTHAPLSLHPHLEHHFPVHSSLVRADRGILCSLAQESAIQTPPITSYLNALTSIHLAAGSSDPSHLTLTSLGCLTVVSN